MSEVTIPLGLLLLGTAAMLWQMVQADRKRSRKARSPGPAAPPEETKKEDHGDAAC